jgi:hypothetical protein
LLQHRIHAVVNTFHVDAKDAVKFLFGGVFKLSDMSDAGVVDQDVDRLLAPNAGKDVVDLPLVGNVTAVPMGCSAVGTNALRSLFRTLLVNFENVDCRPSGSEAESNGFADAAGAAGNDGRFAV